MSNSQSTGNAKVSGLDELGVSALSNTINSMSISSAEKSDLFIAASTMTKMLEGVYGEENLLQNSWSSCGAETFSMRIGPNYHKHKQKGPSGQALYEFAGVE
jgi:hypothetical protein